MVINLREAILLKATSSHHSGLMRAYKTVWHEIISSELASEIQSFTSSL
jgi:hypothetical protein